MALVRMFVFRDEAIAFCMVFPDVMLVKKIAAARICVLSLSAY